MSVIRNEPSAVQTPVTMDQFERIVALIMAQKNPDAPETSMAVNLLRDLKEDIGRANPKSNATGRNCSVFTFKPKCHACENSLTHEDTGEYAHAKPSLKFQAFQCGVPMRYDDLTVTEVDLINQFTQNKEARNGAWTATIDNKGTTPRLLIQYPATDLLVTLGQIPSLTLILLELLHGANSVDPMNMIEEMRRMRAELDALKAEKVA